MRVAYILEGSVRKVGDRVRISSQLVETGSGKHIWAERFDRDLTDVFEVQDEITTLIVGALEPELGHAERSLARRRPPENLDAWGHYQRGLDYMYQRTAQGDASAEREFRRAIELDPEFAAPLASLAYTRTQAVYQELPDDVFRERITEAIDLATQAIALDPGDALAHCALGRALENSRELDRALEANKTAVQLNPSSATCRRALGFSLLHSGDAKASIPEFKVALKMSPRDPERSSFCHGIALALLSEHEFDDALVWVERAISAPNPVNWALVTRAAILGCLGRKEHARAALVAAHEHVPGLSVAYARQIWSRASRCSPLIDAVAEGLALAGLRHE